MITLYFSLNDGNIDSINFSESFLDNISDDELFEVAEMEFTKKYGYSVRVLSCGGNPVEYLD